MISRTTSGASPERRLVTEENPRAAHEGAGDREHLLLASGQRPRELIATLAQHREQPVGLADALVESLLEAAPARAARSRRAGDCPAR
jgi:hypothetical protein